MEQCSKCGNISVNEQGDCVVCDENASINPYAVSDAVSNTESPVLSAESSHDDYVKAFVGPKYYSFFPHGAGIPKKWNWAAFFLGVFWFIYRKMYLYAAIYLGAGLALTAVQGLLGLPEGFTNAVSLALGVAAAMLANGLYKTHIDKNIAETLSMVKGSETIPVLKAKGGTNLIGALVCGVLLVIVVVLSASVATGM
ncbi:DUF2628 domain-containing protein [Budvicia diplopodorum]|uniref:DUF2628 domain-containing protein n=1 Tax=Budvicia diplopodorum TaxID=1119056 RepID=UPI00135C8E08|nr:DUF2628 domain-containing protein [Budvicia diplopodorum]